MTPAVARSPSLACWSPLCASIWLRDQAIENAHGDAQRDDDQRVDRQFDHGIAKVIGQSASHP